MRTLHTPVTAVGQPRDRIRTKDEIMFISPSLARALIDAPLGVLFPILPFRASPSAAAPRDMGIDDRTYRRFAPAFRS